MLERSRHLPSPALVISAIALAMAIGGGAFAIADSDTKSDKKIAKKVANKVLTARASRLSVAHAKTAGSATDAVHASSADTSTNANHAANADQLGGQPPSAFAPAASAPQKILVDTSSAGTTDIGMIGPYDFKVQCTIDTGTNTNTVQLRINGPAGTVDRWGLAQADTLTPETRFTHASVPAATDTAIGTINASGGTAQAGQTGEIETGSTLVSYQLVLFASQGTTNQCSVHGTASASS